MRVIKLSANRSLAVMAWITLSALGAACAVAPCSISCRTGVGIASLSEPITLRAPFAGRVDSVVAVGSKLGVGSPTYRIAVLTSTAAEDALADLRRDLRPDSTPSLVKGDTASSVIKTGATTSRDKQDSTASSAYCDVLICEITTIAPTSQIAKRLQELRKQLEAAIQEETSRRAAYGGEAGWVAVSNVTLGELNRQLINFVAIDSPAVIRDLRERASRMRRVYDLRSIRAPFAAEVIRVDAPSGTMVNAGDAIATVAPLGSRVVMVDLPSKDRLANAVRGDTVALQLNSFMSSLGREEQEALSRSGIAMRRLRRSAVFGAIVLERGLVRSGDRMRLTLLVPLLWHDGAWEILVCVDECATQSASLTRQDARWRYENGSSGTHLLLRTSVAPIRDEAIYGAKVRPRALARGVSLNAIW
jgi:hypothetical protein